jgi:hypothetical protein
VRAHEAQGGEGAGAAEALAPVEGEGPAGGRVGEAEEAGGGGGGGGGPAANAEVDGVESVVEDGLTVVLGAVEAQATPRSRRMSEQYSQGLKSLLQKRPPR